MPYSRFHVDKIVSLEDWREKCWDRRYPAFYGKKSLEYIGSLFGINSAYIIAVDDKPHIWTNMRQVIHVVPYNGGTQVNQDYNTYTSKREKYFTPKKESKFDDILYKIAKYFENYFYQTLNALSKQDNNNNSIINSNNTNNVNHDDDEKNNNNYNDNDDNETSTNDYDTNDYDTNDYDTNDYDTNDYDNNNDNDNNDDNSDKKSFKKPPQASFSISTSIDNNNNSHYYDYENVNKNDINSYSSFNNHQNIYNKHDDSNTMQKKWK